MNLTRRSLNQEALPTTTSLPLRSVWTTLLGRNWSCHRPFSAAGLPLIVALYVPLNDDDAASATFVRIPSPTTIGSTRLITERQG